MPLTRGTLTIHCSPASPLWKCWMTSELGHSPPPARPLWHRSPTGPESLQNSSKRGCRAWPRGFAPTHAGPRFRRRWNRSHGRFSASSSRSRSRTSISSCHFPERSSGGIGGRASTCPRHLRMLVRAHVLGGGVMVDRQSADYDSHRDDKQIWFRICGQSAFET